MRRSCSLFLMSMLLHVGQEKVFVRSQESSPLFPSVPGSVPTRSMNAVVEWNQALQSVIRESNVSALAVRLFALEALGVWQAVQANVAATTPGNETAVVGVAIFAILSILLCSMSILTQI